MEEVKEETLIEEVKEEETPKYILTKPKAPDIFTMVDIIGKIGINKFSGCLQNEEVQKLVKEISKKKSISSEDISMIAGIGVFTEVAQVILVSMPVCEEKIYKLLSDTSNLSIEEVKALDGVTFLEMIIEFFKTNTDFIKAASKYIK